MDTSVSVHAFFQNTAAIMVGWWEGNMDHKNPCHLSPKYSLSKLVEKGNQGESADPDSPGNQPPTWRWWPQISLGWNSKGSGGFPQARWPSCHQYIHDEFWGTGISISALRGKEVSAYGNKHKLRMWNMSLNDNDNYEYDDHTTTTTTIATATITTCIKGSFSFLGLLVHPAHQRLFSYVLYKSTIDTDMPFLSPNQQCQSTEGWW